MFARKIAHLSIPLASLAALTAPAAAHTGHAPLFGFSSGFLHPLMGADHVLAMVAVGLLAAVVGGRALWLVPASFVLAMLAGGALALAGVALPMVESAILASVVVLGVAVASVRGMPVAGAMALVAAFAVFHGHAHGTEMPTAASAAAYGLGFVAATALLHAAGLGLARVAGRATARTGLSVVRLGGGAIAALGVVLALV